VTGVASLSAGTEMVLRLNLSTDPSVKGLAIVAPGRPFRVEAARGGGSQCL
jgi:hypothetical protein